MSDEINIDSRGETLNDATAWLSEIEYINNPQFLNSLSLNLYRVSPYITHVEFITDENQQKMLIFLKLTWWGSLWHKDKIAQHILEMLGQVLPSYTFRVIYNETHFNSALERVKQVNMSKKP